MITCTFTSRTITVVLRAICRRDVTKIKRGARKQHVQSFYTQKDSETNLMVYKHFAHYYVVLSRDSSLMVFGVTQAFSRLCFCPRLFFFFLFLDLVISLLVVLIFESRCLCHLCIIPQFLLFKKIIKNLSDVTLPVVSQTEYSYKEEMSCDFSFFFFFFPLILPPFPCFPSLGLDAFGLQGHLMFNGS